jgi:hypothetical protein
MDATLKGLAILAVGAVLVLAAIALAGPSDFVVGNDLIVRGERIGHGEMFVDDSSATVTLTVQNQWEEINGLGAGDLSGYTFADSDLTAGADAVGHTLIVYSVSFTGSTGKTLEFGVSVNDAVQSGCKSERKLGSTDIGNTGGVCLLDIVSGDVLKLEVRGLDLVVADIVARDVGFVAQR